MATRLLEELISTARREGLDILQVHPSDQALALYQRLGFIDHPGSLDLDLAPTLCGAGPFAVSTVRPADLLPPGTSLA